MGKSPVKRSPTATEEDERLTLSLSLLEIMRSLGLIAMTFMLLLLLLTIEDLLLLTRALLSRSVRDPDDDEGGEEEEVVAAVVVLVLRTVLFRSNDVSSVLDFVGSGSCERRVERTEVDLGDLVVVAAVESELATLFGDEAGEERYPPPGGDRECMLSMPLSASPGLFWLSFVAIIGGGGGGGGGRHSLALCLISKDIPLLPVTVVDTLLLLLLRRESGEQGVRAPSCATTLAIRLALLLPPLFRPRVAAPWMGSGRAKDDELPSFPQVEENWPNSFKSCCCWVGIFSTGSIVREGLLLLLLVNLIASSVAAVNVGGRGKTSSEEEEEDFAGV